jgi:hypothetical protein
MVAIAVAALSTLIGFAGPLPSSGHTGALQTGYCHRGRNLCVGGRGAPMRDGCGSS